MLQLARDQQLAMSQALIFLPSTLQLFLKLQKLLELRQRSSSLLLVNFRMQPVLELCRFDTFSEFLTVRVQVKKF